MVSLETFDKTFASINSFEATSNGTYEKTAKTSIGKVKCLVKWWENDTYRLELWKCLDDDDGFGIIYGLSSGSSDQNNIESSEFAICTNFCGHPFVMTKNLSFANSDGSTWIEIDVGSLSLLELKSYFCERIVEYTLDQVH